MSIQQFIQPSALLIVEHRCFGSLLKLARHPLQSFGTAARVHACWATQVRLEVHAAWLCCSTKTQASLICAHNGYCICFCCVSAVQALGQQATRSRHFRGNRAPQKHPATMKLYVIAALAAIVMATLPRGSYATNDVVLNFKVLDCNNQ
jgi:hypothetical protein